MGTFYIAIAAFVVGFLPQPVVTSEKLAETKSTLSEATTMPAPQASWLVGMAPIYDEDGKLHIFDVSVPKNTQWAIGSKIVHWVADRPDGPYTLVGKVLGSDDASYKTVCITRS
ncbi:hypothetical protein [Pseudoalteromonas sp. ZZD1]|uniref:hypothetical protein n=1 Tax=Pseudoalteromonas sp. ZZD1 TaxID=3139395 RepID=UPI003BAAAC6E